MKVYDGEEKSVFLQLLFVVFFLSSVEFVPDVRRKLIILVSYGTMQGGTEQI